MAAANVPSTPSTAVDRLRSIQVLRAVAVVAVVACHAWRSGRGSSGVDLFFVVSGFIIARVSQGRDPLGFAAARGLRIYPIYWLAAAPYVAFQLRDSEISTLLATLTLWPIWDGAYHEPFLPVAWSLYFEVLFYGGMAVWLASRKAAVCAAFVIMTVAIARPSQVSAFVLSPIILEFVAGIALSRLRRFPLPLPALLVGLGLLFLPDRSFEGGTMLIAGEAISRLLLYGTGAILTVYAALALEHVAEQPMATPVVRIGDASYSIYLTHLVVVRGFMAYPPAVRTTGAILTGIAVYAAIERPLGRVCRKLLARSRRSRRSSPGANDMLLQKPTQPANGNLAPFG